MPMNDKQQKNTRDLLDWIFEHLNQYPPHDLRGKPLDIGGWMHNTEQLLCETEGECDEAG